MSPLALAARPATAPRSPSSDVYTIADVLLEVRTRDARMRRAVDARLRPGRAPGRAGEVRVTFVPVAALPAAPGPAARVVYDSPAGAVSYTDANDVLRVRYGGVVDAACRASAGQARIRYVHGSPQARWIASHPVLSLCAGELLRWRGRFPLHAAALAAGGQGLLLAGRSGAGKSTLALALLRAGFGFLGDDGCFLAAGSHGVRVFALPDEIDVTRATVAFFPELAFLRGRRPPAGSRKRQLKAEEAGGGAWLAECTARALVFPRVTGEAHSRLQPMGAGEALLELVPNVLLTEPARGQAHLAALATLVRECTCHRLWTGRDLAAVPALLEGLLRT
jgi:hypothetical protein